MGKFMKPGKVVMVLAGRYAGRKAVIVKVSVKKVVSQMMWHHNLGDLGSILSLDVIGWPRNLH